MPISVLLVASGVSVVPILAGAVIVLIGLGLVANPRVTRLAVEAHQDLESLRADEHVEVSCAFRVRVPFRIYVSYPLGGMFLGEHVLVFMGGFGRKPEHLHGIRLLRADTTAIVDKGRGFVFDKFVVKSTPHSVTVYLHKRDTPEMLTHLKRLGWPLIDG